MGEMPSGATAIAGFFTISGFPMARTIFENYSTADVAFERPFERLRASLRRHRRTKMAVEAVAVTTAAGA